MTQIPFGNHAHGIGDVAVIGAGPAGSAVSYYLHGLQPELAVSIFESSNYLGGRSTTIDVLGEDVELGASIFVDVNRHLKSAANDFNLTIEDSNSELSESEEALAIWNGNDFVFTDSGGSGYWNLAKLVWKYGLSPYRAKKHVDKVIDEFLDIYDRPPSRSLTQLAAESGLLAYTNITGAQSYAAAGVSPAFYGDIINAATRVNYAQEITKLHGLMSAVSFVTEAGLSIRGGNWQIFSEMVKRSGASLHLNTPITTVSREDDSLWKVCTAEGKCSKFRHVVVTAPAALNGITITPLPGFEKVEYVHLHVTLLATKRRLSSSYFHLKPDQVVPGSIMTTTRPDEATPPFQSISIVGKVKGSGTLIYKIFSLERPSDDLLHTLFSSSEEESGHKDDWLEFLYRHAWNAYPYGDTTTTFDDFELLGQGSGLWYTSTMERFISTMETATLAAENVARLIHDDLSE